MLDLVHNKMFKLKKDCFYADRVKDIIIDDELILDSYRNLRNGCVFTTKRIILLSVHGLIKEKKEFTSIPYTNIYLYAIETVGWLGMTTRLNIYIQDIGRLKFKFNRKTDIIEISKLFTKYTK